MTDTAECYQVRVKRRKTRGPEGIVYITAIDIGRKNDAHMQLSTVIYGNSTARIRAWITKSFSRRMGSSRRTIPSAILNPQES